MFSPAISDDSLFSIVTKNQLSSSPDTTPKTLPIQSFQNVAKIGAARFLLGKSRQMICLQLNDKSIYELGSKSLKVLRLIPYESIREIKSLSNRSFDLDGVVYESHVALQIVAEVRRRKREIMERRERNREKIIAQSSSTESSGAMSIGGASPSHLDERHLSVSMENGASVGSVASSLSISPAKDGASLGRQEAFLGQNDPSHLSTADIPDDFMFESGTSSLDPASPFRPSKRDKLAKILGITKDERLNLEADKIILDHSTDEGRTCLQFVKDFGTQFGTGDRIQPNAPRETRIFLDKMKRYIVSKRGENFEALLGSSSGRGSTTFLTQHIAAEIDAETREKNDAIEKSLERAIITDSVRKSLLHAFYVADPELQERERRFEEKLNQHFSKASQSHFQIPESLQSPTEWRSCAHDLFKLNYAQYPYEMVQIILDTARKICTLFKEEHPENASAVLAADDLLPLMIFIITRADIQRPFQMMEYITSLMDPLIMSQEEGYYCTLYNSALTVLEGMDVEGEDEGDDGVGGGEDQLGAENSEEQESCTVSTGAPGGVRQSILLQSGSNTPTPTPNTLPIPCIEKIRYFSSTASKEKIFSQSYYPLENPHPRAHVLCVHGLHEHSGRNVPLFTRLVKGNLAVHTMDLVGHGHSTGLRGYMDSIEAFIEDFIQFATLIREEHPESVDHLPTYCIGYGLACTILFGAIVEKPTWFAGCTFICPSFFPNKNYSAFLQSISRLVEVLAPKKPLVEFVISTDEKVQQEFEKDPMVVRGKVLVKTASNILRFQTKIATMLPRFQVPFLFLRAKHDHISDQQKDVQLYDLLSVEDKELRVFDACHALLHSGQRQQVIEEIYRWINARVKVHTGVERVGGGGESEEFEGNVESGETAGEMEERVETAGEMTAADETAPVDEENGVVEQLQTDGDVQNGVEERVDAAEDVVGTLPSGEVSIVEESVTPAEAVDVDQSAAEEDSQEAVAPGETSAEDESGIPVDTSATREDTTTPAERSKESHESGIPVEEDSISYPPPNEVNTNMPEIHKSLEHQDTSQKPSTDSHLPNPAEDSEIVSPAE